MFLFFVCWFCFGMFLFCYVFLFFFFTMKNTVVLAILIFGESCWLKGHLFLCSSLFNIVLFVLLAFV